jgi:hypothetical protein
MLQQISFDQSPVIVTQGALRPIGFLPGTMIRTPQGDTPVESLLAGDIVLTAQGDWVELRGTSVLNARRLDVVRVSAKQPKDAAVTPERDLVLPVDHPVLVSDWRAQVIFGQSQMLTSAASLVDDCHVTRETRRAQRLTRLHFDTPQVILANGVPAASARDRAPVAANDSTRH